MTTRRLFALLALGCAPLVACDSKSGAPTGSTGAKMAESGTKRGSAGGFSMMLAQELGAPEGSMGAAAPGAAMTAGGAATTAPPSGAGTAPTAAPTAPTAAPTATPTAPTAAGTASGKGSGAMVAAAPTKPGAPGTAPPAGAAAAGGGKVAAAPTGAQAAGGQTATAGAPPTAAIKTAPAAAPSANRAHVKPPPELAAIKFDLEPNWDRDYGEAGTFSLVVKVPGSEEQRVFSVRYGYDDQAAPADCDQYRKFLEEKKIMAPKLNRQRGGACYVESDTTFRYLVNYGGKRLMCSGSLYKDAASAALGDLRDKVLMQAKKICETLAL